MQPDATERTGDGLFPVHAAVAAADYLAFLAKRVPKDLAIQLDDDGQPDIGMPHQTVNVADLVKPLSSGVFPSDNLSHMTDLLGYILIGYGVGPAADPSSVDPYKMIYAGSLYLHCFVNGGGSPPASGYVGGIHVLVTASLKLDVPSRLQVCRFFASLVPMLPVGSTDEPAALSGLLLGLSLIIGSILGDVSVFAERVMKSEFLGTDAEENREYAFEELAVLKNLLVDVFGGSGKVRRGADRFMVAIEDRGGDD